MISSNLFEINTLILCDVRFPDNEKRELEQQPVGAGGTQRDDARTPRDLSANSAATMHHAFTRAIDKRKLKA